MRFLCVVLTIFPHLIFEAGLWQSLAAPKAFKSIFGTVLALELNHRTFLGLFEIASVDLLVPSQPPTFAVALIRRYVVRTVSVFLALFANCFAFCFGAVFVFHVEGIQVLRRLVFFACITFHCLLNLVARPTRGTGGCEGPCCPHLSSTLRASFGAIDAASGSMRFLSVPGNVLLLLLLLSLAHV